MFSSEYSEDQRPLTYIHGYPVHAATLIVAVYVVTLLATTILQAAMTEPVADPVVGSWLRFDSTLILGGGQVWRFLTYGLWNPPTLGFVIDMAMIVWFGRELERFFGRKIFLRFYGALYLLQPLVHTALGLLRPTSLVGETGAFALFIAFATLYPNVALLFNILAKWLAVTLVGIYTLMALAAQDLVGLVALWSTVGFAHAAVRYEQGRLTLPKLPRFRRGPKLRVLPTPGPASERAADEAPSDVDELLDKISRSGIGSLTAKERARLEQARAELMKKERQ